MPFQSAQRVVMIRPLGFHANAETAVDNDFQHQNDEDLMEIERRACSEFDVLVDQLRNNGIDCLVLDPLNPQETPDAVFPNNWFSVDHQGNLTIFPMAHPSRQKEVRPDIVQKLVDWGCLIRGAHDLRESAPNDCFLEGTGSLVYDHVHRLAFMARSVRSNAFLAERHCHDLGYRLIAFDTVALPGKSPIYHTNVLLSIMSEAIVFCPEIVHELDRRRVMQELLNTSRKIIEIDLNQLFAFAGNVLELKNASANSVMVMSNSAYLAYTKVQIEELSEFNDLVISDLKTIEKYGGGSARCMIAEIFAPLV